MRTIYLRNAAGEVVGFTKLQGEDLVTYSRAGKEISRTKYTPPPKKKRGDASRFKNKS